VIAYKKLAARLMAEHIAAVAAAGAAPKKRRQHKPFLVSPGPVAVAISAAGPSTPPQRDSDSEDEGGGAAVGKDTKASRKAGKRPRLAPRGGGKE